MTHALRFPVLGVVALAMLVGCTGTPSVSAGDVEEQAQQEFSEQFPVDSVECSDELPAEVGASITCVLVSEGTSFEMTATVSDVQGDEADFDLELTRELEGETSEDETSEEETTS